MDIQRQGFEELWLKSNGHFKYFKFSEEHGEYISTGIRDNLTDEELLFASITVNTAYLFFIGGVKTAQKVAVPVLTNKMICAIERKVEEQLLASAITADPFRLDGEKIFYAMIEAQEE